VLQKPPPPNVSMEHVNALKVLDVDARHGEPLDA
jgi:hypothetical protein